MAPSPADLDWLFKRRLRSMSQSSFVRWCHEHDVMPGGLTWTDEQGHAWSPVSRLGYLWLTHPEPPRNPALMAHLLNQEPSANVRSQPGELDLVWAWLGVQRHRKHHRDLDSALTLAFQALLGVEPALRGPAAQGWWAQTLALFEKVATHEGPAVLAALPGAWFAHSTFLGPNFAVKLGEMDREWAPVIERIDKHPDSAEARAFLAELVQLAWRVVDARGDGATDCSEAGWWEHWLLWQRCHQGFDEALWNQLARRTLARMDAGMTTQSGYGSPWAFTAMRGLLLRPLDWASDEEQDRMWQVVHTLAEALPHKMTDAALRAWYEQGRLQRTVGTPAVAEGRRPRL